MTISKQRQMVCDFQHLTLRLTPKFRIIAPIEQNVNGQNGYYQLEYIRKPSKFLQDFKRRQGNRKAFEGSDIQVETQYWKSLRNQAPIYGADQSNSLFDAGVPWNLSELKTILK